MRGYFFRMNILSKLKSDFAKSVITLVSGTVISQIIVLALYPIISRIYTPEESAYYSVYMRIIVFIPNKNIIYTNFDNWFFYVIFGLYYISYYGTC